MSEALRTFHSWLKARIAAVHPGGDRKTYEDGYRNGYSNALEDALENLEDLEWDTGEETEWAG